MAKNSKKRHQSKSKRKSNGRIPPVVPGEPAEAAVSTGLSQLGLDDIEIGKQSTAEDDLGNETTRFGFDGICMRCKRLYNKSMSPAIFTEHQCVEKSQRLGDISHISAEASCDMCRSLFAIRWSTSETNRYHLHAFSAARLLYGESIKTLNASRFEFIEPLYDSVLFAVIPDSATQVSATSAMDMRSIECFLLATDQGFVQTRGGKHSSFSLGNDRDPWTREAQKSLRALIKSTGHQANYVDVVRGYALSEIVLPPLSALSDSEPEVQGGSEIKAVKCSTAKVRERRAALNQRISNDRGYSSTYWNLTSAGNKISKLLSLTFFGRRISSSSIHYSVLQEWLSQCRSHCLYLSHFVVDRERFQSLPFWLLDCRKRQIFKIPHTRGHKYIALSYVWGNADLSCRAAVQKFPFSLPDRCPNVIEDAITVTVALGFEYLWVDCLCVSGQASVRHEQVANMDAVYKNAVLTIVAAAGSNADHGLPGVSQPRRCAQTKIRAGNHEYVSITIDPAHQLKTSVYETRGWTYQEYFFSRRRLVFTDSQVYFECGADCTPQHQQEVFFCPRRRLPVGKENPEYVGLKYTGDGFLERISSAWEDSVYATDGSITKLRAPFIDKTFYLVAYEHHVSAYTKRSLSFQTDSLQAVLSILDRFKHERYGIYHIQGLPLMPRSYNGYKQGDCIHLLDFKYGLLWTHGSQSIPKTRRAGFPSWSWIGWEGQVNWIVHTTDMKKLKSSSKWESRFQFRTSPRKGTSELCDVDEWRPWLKDHRQPEELFFTAKLYDMLFQIELSNDREGDECTAVYLNNSSERCRLHVTQIDFDELRKIKQKVFHGIWLCRVSRCVFALVLRPTTSKGSTHGGEYFERVGVIMIPASWPGWKGGSRVQGWLV